MGCGGFRDRSRCVSEHLAHASPRPRPRQVADAAARVKVIRDARTAWPSLRAAQDKAYSVRLLRARIVIFSPRRLTAQTVSRFKFRFALGRLVNGLLSVLA